MASQLIALCLVVEMFDDGLRQENYLGSFLWQSQCGLYLHGRLHEVSYCVLMVEIVILGQMMLA